MGHWLRDGPATPQVFEQCWKSWCDGHRERSSIDSDTAFAVLIEGFQSDERVVNRLGELIRAGDHSLSMGPCEWDVLRRTHRAHPILQPIVDERLRLPVNESELFEPDLAYAALVSGSEEAKSALLKRLPDSGGFKFWPIWALLDTWGMEDPEVAEVLHVVADSKPSELQYFAHHLPAIVGNTPECRDTLLRIARHPGLERKDFVAGGLASLDRSLWSDEVIEVAVGLCQAPHPLYDPKPAVIAAFGSAPPARRLAEDLMDSMDAPLAAMVRQYGDDPALRTRILERLSPLSKDLRLQIIDHAVSGGSDDPGWVAVLRDYENEKDAEVRTAAATHYYRQFRGSAKLRRDIADILQGELGARGPDMDAIQQAAFGGLVGSGHVDLFARMVGTHDDKPARINAFRPALHQNTRLMREMAENWGKISDSLGDEMMLRLTSFGTRDARGVWERIAPFVNSDKPIANDFLAYCREESRPLGANVLSALERVEGGSVLLAESCKRCFERGPSDRETSFFDSTAAALTAGRIVGRRFSADESIRAILE